MITSTSNPHVKYVRSLNTQQHQRLSERRFVLEGVRLVAEALNRVTPLHLVLYAPDQLVSTAAGRQLCSQLQHQPHSYAAREHVVAAASATVSPQGVVAVASWPDLQAPPGLILILDGVQDPGNVGTLLRSAEAAGVAQVLCSQGTADCYSPKVTRSAMGAHFSLPLQTGLDWSTIAQIVAPLAHVYATQIRTEQSYYDVNWCNDAALLIGSEAQGISSEGIALANETISIPIVGRTESLNAAVAGSIILFEALRQRQRNHSL
ncbi:MAG: RNA methyltransferase [Chloroflexaceae bacterium]|nr:RNA methyltransferase [Chloroflexaceae bacterium]